MKHTLRIASIGIAGTLASIVLARTAGAASTYSGTITGRFDGPVVSGAFLQAGTRQPVAQDNTNSASGLGMGTSTVTWGGGDQSGRLAPSSLAFVGNAFDDVAQRQVFPLGTLTYFNGPGAPASLIFGVTMHLSAGDGITPFAGPIGIVSTVNANVDRVADADLLSFGGLEVPSTLAAFENTAVVARIFGKIGTDDQLEVTSVSLAPGEEAHGCVDDGPFVESKLPCASRCGNVCAAATLALAGPLCGTEPLPAILTGRIGRAIASLRRGAGAHSERKARRAVRLAMKQLRAAVATAGGAAKAGRISAPCGEAVGRAVGNAQSQAEPWLTQQAAVTGRRNGRRSIGRRLRVIGAEGVEAGR